MHFGVEIIVGERISSSGFNAFELMPSTEDDSVSDNDKRF